MESMAGRVLEDEGKAMTWRRRSDFYETEEEEDSFQAKRKPDRRSNWLRREMADNPPERRKRKRLYQTDKRKDWI